ncbi:hypothetical protein QBC40DRAFT_310344 [Triangularia verruculosa]|uniref:Uncharacterized protein n=1 Tax=Triangularia verruculosa TaxID=2587418 RepID=A0AAN6X846_9PEZI|nr:hypothetical protein QBC40DRAFT_310344 [Triangularia verruculosa]
MPSIVHLSALLAAALVGIATSISPAATVPHPPLNITALSSREGYSVIECWQLASIPMEAMQAANYIVGGQTTKAVWSRIEPRTHVGEAWAPHAQLSIILNGLIRITSPAPSQRESGRGPMNDSVMPSIGVGGSGMGEVAEDHDDDRPKTRTAYIMPGTLKSSVLIAADLKSVSTLAGHYTEFPSDEPTVLVQIPFEGDVVPDHTVLHEGSCH